MVLLEGLQKFAGIKEAVIMHAFIQVCVDVSLNFPGLR